MMEKKAARKQNRSCLFSTNGNGFQWFPVMIASRARSYRAKHYGVFPAAHSPQPATKHQSGVTLVELIIAIVIISIASVALLQGLGLQTQRNVDPMIQSQANALARQYLEEALSRSFFDPTADPRVDPSITQAQATAAVRDISSRTANPTNRLAFNNVYEYNGFSQPIQAPNGTAIPELSGYSVSISVDLSGGLTLGSVNNPADTNNCPASIMLVTVTVSDPRGQLTVLNGYRTSYFDTSSRYTGC